MTTPATCITPGAGLTAVVEANCCIGWIDAVSSCSFHPRKFVPVQSP
jgi:hypothetical protein